MSDRAKWSPERPDWWNRFHELWTLAVGQPGYNKKDWIELEEELERLLANRYISPPHILPAREIWHSSGSRRG